MSTKGVIYMSFHSKKYLKEVMRSVRSLRRHNSGLSVTLFTDIPYGVDMSLFNDVRPIKAPPRGKELGAKIVAMQGAPYDRFLFLDGDTHICGNLSEMFGVLDGYDIAMAMAPRRTDPSGLAAYGELIPEWFPEPNTGVALCKKGPGLDNLLRECSSMYAMLGKWNDQISVRVALYHEIFERGLRLYTLPPEYNCRTIMLQFIGSKVYILHGRGEDMDRICRQINSRIGARIWMPKHGLFRWSDWKYEAGTKA